MAAGGTRHVESDDAVFIAGHAHMLCLERVVKCQSRNPESTSCGGGE